MGKYGKRMLSNNEARKLQPPPRPRPRWNPHTRVGIELALRDPLPRGLIPQQRIVIPPAAQRLPRRRGAMRLAEPDALELQNAAELVIAISDKQRGAIRRNRDAARRAVEVERLGAVEGDGVEDIDDVLGFSGEEDAAPATDG